MDPDPDISDSRPEPSTQHPSRTAGHGGQQGAAQSRAPEHRPRAQIPQDLKRRYSAFYRERMPRLVAYAAQLGATPAQAADISQEVLVDMLKKFDSYTHPYVIARREVRRRYMDLVFNAFEEPSEELENRGQPLIGDPQAFEELEYRFHYLPLLRRLPLKQRIAMALRLDGASPSEIAEELGGEATSEQVRSNLTNARRNLRDFLRQAEREQGIGE